MNSLLLKGLLSALMLSKAPVEPICVSIDTYTTADRDTIYLLGNAPVGTPELLKQELTAFIQAAKSKHDAYVIAQDFSSYYGNSYLVKQAIDAYYEKFTNSDEIHYDGTLIGLTRSCYDHQIPVFNAERRHETFFHLPTHPPADKEYYKATLEADAAYVIPHLKQFYTIDWLLDHPQAYQKYVIEIRILQGLHELIQKKIPVDHKQLGRLNMIFPALSRPASEPKQKKSSSKQPKTDNSDGKKHIFVHVDRRHIYNIIAVLENHLHCTKTRSPHDKDYSIERYNEDEWRDNQKHGLLYSNIEERLSQREAQQYIDEHQVNISDYFAEEK